MKATAPKLMEIRLNFCQFLEEYRKKNIRSFAGGGGVHVNEVLLNSISIARFYIYLHRSECNDSNDPLARYYYTLDSNRASSNHCNLFPYIELFDPHQLAPFAVQYNLSFH